MNGELTSTTAPPERAGPLDRVARRILPPAGSLGERGSILTPLVLVFVLSLLASAGMQPSLERAYGAESAAMARSVAVSVWALAVLAPVVAALRGALFAAIAWALLALLGGAPKGKGLVSALLYGEAIFALQSLWVAAGAWVTGAVPSPGAPLPVPTGLDAWIRPESAALAQVVAAVTPFHVAWLVFMAFAFTAQGAVSRSRGAAVAATLWCVGAGVGVLRALLVGG